MRQNRLRPWLAPSRALVGPSPARPAAGGSNVLPWRQQKGWPMRFLHAATHAPQPSTAGRGVHRQIGVVFPQLHRVRLRRGTRVDRDVAASLDNEIQRATIHHEVFDKRKRLGPKWLHGNDFAVLEAAHVSLAGGHPLFGAMGLAVDDAGARAANCPRGNRCRTRSALHPA